MKAYLNSLNEREKWMVIVAVLAVFIYGYYLLLFDPLSERVKQKSTQLIEKTETLEWMKKVRHQKGIGKSKKSIDNSQLLTLLADRLKESKGLKFPYQLQQTASGEVQLSFEEVPFQLFLSWLTDIHEQYSIYVKQLDVQNTQTPGVTKLSIILTAG
ncbi:GspM family type II secretion system protein LspM [Legionella waltersii]|uniref:Putative general secretion pathway protein YghD n=1 Tax=Legionella waltersii TaxID=66969 RepID=A0A0W1A1P2_9GAMM|nr:GspM family type II secretion system protein LspM [Legionella waltersii]KTD75278.1 putative general secretion pathway protein YghD [Legionella waltersii]SNV06882.1 general secretion pathway protein M [Legionella waltersii]